MRLYSANIEDFYNHVRDNTLADTIRDNFKAHLGRYPGIPEYNSFNPNSAGIPRAAGGGPSAMRARPGGVYASRRAPAMRAENFSRSFQAKSSGQYVKNLAEKAALKDVHISFEYEVPYNTSRIDCLLFGRSAAAKAYVFLMELKQWAAVAELPGEDNFVETFTGGAHRRVAHPSAQVAGYHNHLKNFVKVFETDPDLDLFSCAYCHNYRKDGAAGLFAPKYNKLIAEFPVYTMTEVAGLAGKLKECLSSGHGLEVFNRFAQSPIEPSRKLLDNTAKIISGEKALSLLNEQIVAKNLILAKLEAAKARAEKSVIIVHGGPGTGKSVIAFNLLAELGLKGSQNNVRYACKSKPFREAIQKTVGKESRELFVNLDVFAPAVSKDNAYDVVLVDEAHRIGRKSGHQWTRPEHRTEMPQVEQLVRAAKVSVFFIDDKQVVRGQEVGSTALIREAAAKLKATCEEVELLSQFRCNGSDGYLEWLDSTLGYNDTGRKLVKSDRFEFKVFDTPQKLYDALLKKENSLKAAAPRKNNFARLVAGYCWPWSQQLDENGELVKDVKIGDFAMPWETHDKVKPPEGYVKWFEWAFKPEGIKQVGCIYAAQGFEFDYIGVIIGKDFVYDPLQKKMTGNRIASFDRTLRQNAANFTEYARNIYRVLLSRGMKGCYVYFVDEETKAHFLSRIDSELLGTEPVTAAAPAGLAEKLKQALDILPQIPAALRWTAYLPVYSLQAACGNFGRGMAVEPLGWIKCPPGLKPDRNMFAAQVAGRSMEPKLQDGDYCVFRANPGGSRNNKLVLVQHSSIADPDTGGSYTVKKYTSKKKYAPDGAWQHEEIIMKPLNPAYSPIVIPNAEDEEFMVVAEVVGKCGNNLV